MTKHTNRPPVHKRPAIVRDQEITDSTEDLIFTIKRIDIELAIERDPEQCAAARAIKREHRFPEACVMRKVTYVNTGTKKLPNWKRFMTSEALTREIVAIDRNGDFEPGTYKVRKPSKGHMLGQPKGGKSQPGNRKTPKREPTHYHYTTNIREV